MERLLIPLSIGLIFFSNEGTAQQGKSPTFEEVISLRDAGVFPRKYSN
jgi:hypothetical protein